MNKKLMLAILLVILVMGVVFFLRLNSTGYTIADEQTDEGSRETNVSQTTDKISSTTLAKHNSQSDCWVSYKYKVYDITAFLPKHPGSIAAILKYCGSAEDFENAFTKKHGTSKVSTLMKVGVLIGDFEIVGKI